jgi:hypothetical protein
LVASEKLRQKIVLHRQLTYLRVDLLYCLFVVLRLELVTAKHILSTVNQALLPVLDLIGMNIKLLG